MLTGTQHPDRDIAMRRALNVVKRVFTVRSCNYDMPREMPERACLDFAIKRCKAPCILAQIRPPGGDWSAAETASRASSPRRGA